MFLFKRKSFAFLLSIFLVCLTAFLVTFTFNTQTKTAYADTVTYRSGANSVSTSYKNGRYYANLMQVPITGDGVTDVLAVAMSQMGYQESATEGSYSGESGGSGNYTEFNYNMGSYAASDGYHYAWCASFVSWSLLQSQCTSQNTMGAWCRNHYGDSNYIWREVGCPGWYTQLGQCGYQRTRASGYIPKSGDLIFFYSSSTSSTIGHIGIVVWCNGSTVYTIEGNTSSGTGVEANGGGVYYKSYAVSNTRIAGYGALPYKTNSSALKVDYSGAKKTAGLYMAKTSFTVTTSSGSSYTIPQYRMFKVNSISGSTANITYNGANYTGTLNSNTIQISASTSASQGNPVSSIIVHESSSFNAGGTSIPSGYTSDPCVKVTGLIGSVNNYWELEKYAHNKSLVLINGRTLSIWQDYNAKAIERIWVRNAGTNSLYIGFDFNDTSALRLNSQSGNGEVLDTIILKKGFQFINTHTPLWEQTGKVYKGSSDIAGVVGTLTQNVVLKAKSSGGFEVYYDAQKTVTTQSANQYGQVVNVSTNLNVRSQPNTSSSILGTITNGTELVYLGTSSNGFYNVQYNGQSAWVSDDYFTITGYKTTTSTTKLTLNGYEIVNRQEVVITGDVYLVNTASPASGPNDPIVMTTAFAGERYEYLGSMVDRWYKVNYDGKVGYISSNFSTLDTGSYLTINALNAAFPEVHKHSYVNLQKNETGHWYTCQCGESNAVVNHSFNANGDCSCGYHKHVLKLTNDEVAHWQGCPCGYKESESLHHYLNGVCEECNYHKHEYYNRYDDEAHWQVCTCGDVINREEHNFIDGACDGCAYVVDDTVNGENPPNDDNNNDVTPPNSDINTNNPPANDNVNNENGEDNSSGLDLGCAMAIGKNEGAISLISFVLLATAIFVMIKVIRKNKKSI